MVRHALERTTGFVAQIHSLNIHLTQPRCTALDVTIENPRDLCKEPVALRIDLLELDYKPGSILGRKPHFRRIVLNISEVIAVKNAQGELNLRRLQRARDDSGPGAKPADLQVDELVLSIGTLRYVDERRENPNPAIYKIEVKDRVYNNIQSSEDIKAIVTNLVAESAPRNLLNLATQIVDEGLQKVSETLDQGAQTLRNLFGGQEKKESPP